MRKKVLTKGMWCVILTKLTPLRAPAGPRKRARCTLKIKHCKNTKRLCFVAYANKHQQRKGLLQSCKNNNYKRFYLRFEAMR